MIVIVNPQANPVPSCSGMDEGVQVGLVTVLVGLVTSEDETLVGSLVALMMWSATPLSFLPSSFSSSLSLGLCYNKTFAVKLKLYFVAMVSSVHQ